MSGAPIDAERILVSRIRATTRCKIAPYAGPMRLGDEKYVVFTTFKKDGTPKPTPVWPVDAGDGRVGFITSANSWKLERLAYNPRVELQPSDARGRAREGTSPSSGTAVVVEGAEFEAMQSRIREKYGFQLKLIEGLHSIQRLLRRAGQPHDRAVVITLDNP